MLNFSMAELSMILVIALMVFGPGKLPEVGKSLGKGLGEFRRAVTGENSKDEAINIEKQSSDKKPEIK